MRWAEPLGLGVDTYSVAVVGWMALGESGERQPGAMHSHAGCHEDLGDRPCWEVVSPGREKLRCQV